MENKKEFMHHFGEFCAAAIAFCIAIVLGAFVFYYSYEWFIIPVFHTPQVTVLQAYGISFFITAFMKPMQKHDKEKTVLQKCGNTITYYSFIFAVAYIIHLFM